MIHYIKGKIATKMPGKIVVENNGVGFLIYIADSSPLFYAKEDEEVTVYTVMAVREDDISLYGFSNEAEVNMYELLTSVSGIGNKGAMSILSKLSVDEIKKACIYEDADKICTANGIGKKTAQRIVLELKDKIDDGSTVIKAGPDEELRIVKGSAREQALGALVNLGFSKSEASAALYGIDDTGLTTEDLIKLALKNKR